MVGLGMRSEGRWRAGEGKEGVFVGRGDLDLVG